MVWAARDQGDLVVRDGDHLVPRRTVPAPEEKQSHREQDDIRREGDDGEQSVVDLPDGTIGRRLPRDHPNEEHLRLTRLSIRGRIDAGRVARLVTVDRPRQSVLDEVIALDRPRRQQRRLDVPP